MWNTPMLLWLKSNNDDVEDSNNNNNNNNNNASTGTVLPCRATNDLRSFYLTLLVYEKQIFKVFFLRHDIRGDVLLY